jgi:hypothetical protein
VSYYVCFEGGGAASFDSCAAAAVAAVAEVLCKQENSCALCALSTAAAGVAAQ